LTRHRPYGIIKSSREKRKEKKMKVNLWKSTYSGQVYEMPLDWLPQFGGWELIGTIEK